MQFEALNKSTGLGEIVEVSVKNEPKVNVITSGKHYSYPFPFEIYGNEYLMAEVASHSSQYFMNKNNLDEKYFLKGLEKFGLLMLASSNTEVFFIFFGIKGEDLSSLHLWLSGSPAAEFKPHPDSPISFDPSNSRMGGKIIKSKGSIYRFGQDNRGDYGAKLSIMKICSLTPNNYSEELCGEVDLVDAKGPHTLNFNQRGDEIVLDYYKDEFSLFSN